MTRPHPRAPRAVLGIDAAWTPSQPSGVALAVERGGGWACAAVAPSYAEFVRLAAGHAVDWAAPAVAGGEADAGALLDAAAALAPGAGVRVVAVDMPLARGAISRRRACDDALSRAYGARGLGVHTPSAVRPGPVSDRLHRAFAARGFALATPGGPRPERSLVEVYPHAALLAFTASDYRIAYKASRAPRYWPALAPEERRARLLAEWRRILRALAARLGDVDLPLPRAAPRARDMKRYEDALVGVVCALAGIAFLEGRAVAFGDGEAAIWTPA